MPRRNAAFTLLELLAVIAIGALVASCSRDDTPAKMAKVQADLVAIASALEAFKAHHHDYPIVPVDILGEPAPHSAERLWAALSGRRGAPPSDAPLTAPGPSYLSFVSDVAKSNSAKSQVLVDPWGNPYRYFYWPDIAGKYFVLYSAGPDGDAILGNPTDRSLRRSGRAVNEDNIVLVRK